MGIAIFSLTNGHEYRRSYEISSFLHERKTTIVEAIFRHLRDTNLMEHVYKLVVNQNESTPEYQDYDPKKANPEEVTSCWTDEIPGAILAFIGYLTLLCLFSCSLIYHRREESEWTDVEIENISNFVGLVLGNFAKCKLAYQLLSVDFCKPLVSLIFPLPQNGTSCEGEHPPSKTRFRNHTTLISLLSFLVILLKQSINTSTYDTDTPSPLVLQLIGKGNPVPPFRIFFFRLFVMVSLWFLIYHKTMAVAS